MKSRKERRILLLTMKKVLQKAKPKYCPIFIWHLLIRMVLNKKVVRQLDE